MRRVILALVLLLVAGCDARKTVAPTTAAVPTAAPSSAAPVTTPAAAKSAPSGASQSAGNPTSAEAKTPIRRWQISVIEKLQPFMRWPKDAPDDVAVVAPTVQVTIDRKGNVLAVKIAHSSGYKSFDRAAVKIYKSVPILPPPPPELTDDELTFLMAVTFKQNPKPE
jgi:periplasmic protein TonB